MFSEIDTVSKIQTETLLKRDEIIEKHGGIDELRKTSLMEQDSLYNEPQDLFFLYSFMSAQKKAPPIEKFLCKKLGGERVSPSDDRGDAKINGEYYEFKTSTTNDSHSLNVRQIRLYQEDVDFYVCSYIFERDLSKSRFYRLSKHEMSREIEIFGSYTHGTKQANETNKSPEFSITLSALSDTNKHTIRWNKQYWYNDLYVLFNAKD